MACSVENASVPESRALTPAIAMSSRRIRFAWSSAALRSRTSVRPNIDGAARARSATSNVAATSIAERLG